jgi:hypothetical protein
MIIAPVSPDGGVKKVGEQEGAGEGAQLACAGRNAVTGGADIGGEQLGRVDDGTTSRDEGPQKLLLEVRSSSTIHPQFGRCSPSRKLV